jgi:predicted ATPase/class 3 adenylate cyclase
MPELPSGTVTMLFSDIEGSTSLVTRLGSAWGAALSAHRQVVRDVVAALEGVEMGTEGDSFFVVFASARNALAAAVDVQRRVGRLTWPGGVALKLRIGLHTGEPERHDEGYIGIDVHRAARVGATAHGGQVVLTESTARLVDPEAVGVQLRDLGHHRLKDIADPERLYDVVGAGLETQFPPLRTLGSLTELPTYPTELMGREVEMAAVAEALTSGARLVTLLGPGGSGKTRLAVGVAERLQQGFPGTLFFVELHSATAPELMWAGIASSVGAVTDAEEPPEARALSFLRERTALLVLDNLEQIPDAEVVVARLLDVAPGVRVLATSRRPLHLVSEQLYPVAPLPLPAGDAVQVAVAEDSAAVALFVRRAQMVRPAFRLSEDNVVDVVALCRRLDGLPLAIELVAARCRLLSPRATLTRLDTELGGTAAHRDRTERQRTLDGAVAWSYDLLSDSDQVVFRRLGVFAGRVDLEAVEEVVGSESGDPLDTVAHLVDVSLLDVVEGRDGEPVVSMLETIRSFARSRLTQSRENGDVRLRHARWCAAAAAAVAATIHSPHQMRALDRMSALEDDLRAALDWALVPAPASSAEQRECGYRLLVALGTYWYRFGRVIEGRTWRDRAVPVLDAETATSEPFVDALHNVAVMMVQRSEYGEGVRLLERALDSAQALHDLSRESRECNSLGIARRELGELAAARQLLGRSLELARALGDPGRETAALTNLSAVLVDSAEYAAAADLMREAIGIDRALGDPWGVAINEFNLATALLHVEGPEAAWRQLASTARGAVALEDVELSIEVLETASTVLVQLGDPVAGARLLGTADAQRERADLPRNPRDEDSIREALAPARAACGPDAWEASYQAGRGSSLLQAVEDALASRPVGVPVTAGRAARPDG